MLNDNDAHMTFMISTHATQTALKISLPYNHITANMTTVCHIPENKFAAANSREY